MQLGEVRLDEPNKVNRNSAAGYMTGSTKCDFSSGNLKFQLLIGPTN